VFLIFTSDPLEGKECELMRGLGLRQTYKMTRIQKATFVTSRYKRGTTVVEIMLVVAVVSLLTSLAAPVLIRTIHNTNESAAQSSLRTFSSALGMFLSTQNPSTYPTVLSALSGATPPYVSSKLTNATAPRTAVQGYYFSYNRIDGTSYTLEAFPAVPGITGTRHFLIDQTGFIQNSLSSPITSAGGGALQRGSGGSRVSVTPTVGVSAKGPSNTRPKATKKATQKASSQTGKSPSTKTVVTPSQASILLNQSKSSMLSNQNKLTNLFFKQELLFISAKETNAPLETQVKILAEAFDTLSVYMESRAESVGRRGDESAKASFLESASTAKSVASSPETLAQIAQNV
jgi:Tfp pilus assembly protein PilE